jgi:phage terminase small subunit
MEQEFGQKVEAKRTNNETQKNVGIAQKGEGENEVENPKNYDPWEVGHVTVARHVTKALVTSPDAIDEIRKVATKIELGMKCVPTGEKGAGGVVFETEEETNQGKDDRIKKWR